MSYKEVIKLDIEITKLNGDNYRLSDYGINVKDVVVENIESEDKFQDYEGIHGRHLISSVYRKRKILVPVFFIARDNIDYSLQRNLLYELVQDINPFWIRELRKSKKDNYIFKDTVASEYQIVDKNQNPVYQNNTDQFVTAKRYLVKLTNILNPTQKNYTGNVQLEFETTKLPFAESIGTSLELHQQFISDLWSIDEEIDLEDESKQKYIFEKVNSGRVYYHGSIPNNQFNMYKRIKIILGHNTNKFIWSLNNKIIMSIKGLELKKGDQIEYDSLRILKNGESIVRYTNSELPTFESGYNNFVLNQTIKRIEFDMRFYSK
ncbi:MULTISPECIES: phage tail family protein [Staphylococcus]|nr:MULTISPECIES: phage tail family protein [Staphylococcus]